MKPKQIFDPKNIISIFKTKNKLAKVIENMSESKTSEQQALLQIPGLDKQRISQLKANLKSYQNIGDAIKSVDFYYRFSLDVLKNLNIKDDCGIIIVLFQVISCLYIEDTFLSSELYDLLVNSLLKCLNVEKSNYINEVNCILLLVFIKLLKDKRIVLDSKFIKTTIKLFKEDKYIDQEIYFDLISFIKIAMEFNNREFLDDVLSFIIFMFDEKRKVFMDVNEHLLLIEMISPLCKDFNQKSLRILGILSTKFPSKEINDELTNLAKHFTEYVCGSSLQITIVNGKREFELPELKLEKFKLEMINGKSDFTNGFKIKKFSNKWEKEQLISLLSSDIQLKVQVFISCYQYFDFSTLICFLSEYCLILQNKIEDLKFYELYVVFLLLLIPIPEANIINISHSALLNYKVFNLNESMFGPIIVDKTISLFRNVALSLFKNYNMAIQTFIQQKSENLLFVLDVVMRINDKSFFYQPIFLKIFSDICTKLYQCDLIIHNNFIESARNVGFLMLSDLFLNIFDSYFYFEEVMKFSFDKKCLEQFIFLFKKSIDTKKNHKNLIYVFKFIKKIININEEISEKFIKCLADFFQKRPYLNDEIQLFYEILSEFILKEQNNSLLKYLFDFIDKINVFSPTSLKAISWAMSKYDKKQIFEQILAIMGNNVDLQFQSGFVILKPQLLVVLAYCFGFTKTITTLFNNLASFSNINSYYMHKYEIDSLILDLLSNETSETNYKTTKFNVHLESKSEILRLLKTITCTHSDFSIAFRLLSNQNFLPFLCQIACLNFSKHSLKIPISSKPVIIHKKLISSKYFQNDYFTFSFWINFDDPYILSSNKVFNLITVTDVKNNFLKIIFNKSSFITQYQNSLTRTEVNLISSVSTNQKWTYVVIIYNNTSQLVTTYLNGNKVGDSEFTIPKFEKGGLTLHICGNEPSEYYGAIADVTFYSRKIQEDEISIQNSILYKPSNFIVSMTDRDTFEYHQSTFSYSNIYDILTSDTSIEKLLVLLERQINFEINHYILNILNIIQEKVIIPLGPLISYAKRPENYSDNKLYNFFFSMFKKIFDKKTQKKWFNSLIFNIGIWKSYTNFDKIIHFWSNEFLSQISSFIIEKSYFVFVISYIEEIEQKYWPKFLLLLERIACINLNKNSVIHLINYLTKTIDMFPNRPLPTKQQTKVFSFSVKRNFSNFERQNLKIINSCENQENQTVQIKKQNKLQNTHKKITYLLVELVKNISKYISLNVQEIVEYVICKLLPFLRFDDVKIVSSIIYSIHELSKSNFHSYVFLILRELQPYCYHELLLELKSKYDQYPHVFSLMSALLIFNSKNSIYLMNETMFSIILDLPNKNWYFFPVLLLYYLDEGNQVFLIHFIAKSCGSNKNLILDILYLITFFSATLTNNISSLKLITNFLSVILILNPNIKADIYLYACLPLFFTIYETNPRSYSFSNTSDINDFIINDLKTINIKFYLEISENGCLSHQEHISFITSISNNLNSKDQQIIDLIFVVNGIITQIKNDQSAFFLKMNTLFESLQNNYFKNFKESILSQFSDLITNFLFTLDESTFKNVEQSEKHEIYHFHFIAPHYSRSNLLNDDFAQSLIIKTKLNHLMSIKIRPNCKLFTPEGQKPCEFKFHKHIILLKTQLEKICLTLEETWFILKRSMNSIEIFSYIGRSFYLDFSPLTVKEMFKKHKSFKKKFLKDIIPFEHEFINGNLSLFEYLMVLNIYSGRSLNTTNLPLLPPSLQSLDDNPKIQNFQQKQYIYNIKIPSSFLDENEPSLEKHSNIISSYKPEILRDSIKNAFKNDIISPVLYYCFENISLSEELPKFAKNQFDLMYKLRKAFEQVDGIQNWVGCILRLQVPQKPQNDLNTKSFKINLKNDFIFKINPTYLNEISYFIITNQGKLILIYPDGRTTQISHIDFPSSFRIFYLNDGYALLSLKTNQIQVANIQELKTINLEIFYDQTIISGESNRFVFLSSETVIYRYINGYTTFLCEIKSRINQIYCSPKFQIVVVVCNDYKIRIRSFSNGNKISTYDLVNEIPQKILITKHFGFIFISTKTKAIMLNHNGNVIKIINEPFTNVKLWNTFVSNEGTDYISILKENGKFFYFEAYYPEKAQFVFRNDNLINVCYCQNYGFEMLDNELNIKYHQVKNLFSVPLNDTS